MSSLKDMSGKKRDEKTIRHTELEKQALILLPQLEYCSNVVKLSDPDSKKPLVITFGDIGVSSIRKLDDLYGIALYLRERGLNFSITYDFKHYQPHEDVHYGWAETEDEVEIGIVKGESIGAIDAKIHEIIVSLEGGTGVKTPILTAGGAIEKIEVLENKTSRNVVTIYINSEYVSPKEFRSGKHWGLLYELAVNQFTSFNKGFFDYFNSSKLNPLYSKHGYSVTKILKKEGENILPSIKIATTTQNKVSRQLKDT